MQFFVSCIKGQFSQIRLVMPYERIFFMYLFKNETHHVGEI